MSFAMIYAILHKKELSLNSLKFRQKLFSVLRSTLSVFILFFNLNDMINTILLLLFFFQLKGGVRKYYK